MDVNKCFDCGVDNSVAKTESFLCDDCREKEFARLRQLAKGEQEVKSNREKVVELSKQGLKPKEISQKTGIPISTVYKYRHEAKVATKENKTNVKNSKLQKEIKELKEQLNEEKAKHEQLKEFYKHLESKLEHEKKMAKRLSDNFIREQEKHDVLLKYLVMSNEQYARYKFP